MAVKTNLKSFMESLDMTQQALAGATGLSPTIVNRLYHNRFSRLDNGTVETICKFFKVSLGEMFYITSDEDNEDTNSTVHNDNDIHVGLQRTIYIPEFNTSEKTSKT